MYRKSRFYLVLLVLADNVGNIALCLVELHLVHTLTRVQMEEHLRELGCDVCDLVCDVRDLVGDLVFEL